ncbi:MAG: M20/M25/M40 family metallo-hydrolase [Phycisphaerales bacterium]
MSLAPEERELAAALAERAPRMEADLERWVNLPTGWGHEPGLEAMRAELAERLAGLGGRAERWPGDPAPAVMAGAPGAPPAGSPPPTLVVHGPRPEGSRAALIACHLDTVFSPDGPFLRLTRPAPGTVVGPGCADMKGGIAIAVAALEAIAALRLPVAWSAVFNSDEETGSFHSASHLRRLAPGFDVGLATEPAMADGGLVVERMGSGQFRIDCRGRAAHAGRDFERGISAVTALAESLVSAAALAAPRDGRILNVGPIRGGDAANVVPAEASAWGTIRFRDEAAGESLVAGLRALERGDDSNPPSVRTVSVLNRPAKPRTAEVSRMAECCREVSEALGHALPFGATGGTSDGNILQSAGLPVLDSLGVRGGNLHRHDEFVDLASIPWRAALLAITLLRLTRPSAVRSRSG